MGRTHWMWRLALRGGRVFFSKKRHWDQAVSPRYNHCYPYELMYDRHVCMNPLLTVGGAHS